MKAKLVNSRMFVSDRISMSMPLLSNDVFEYVWLCFDKMDDSIIVHMTRNDVRQEIKLGNYWRNR